MKLRDKGKQTSELNEGTTVASDESDLPGAAIEKDVTLTRLETALNHLNDEQKVSITLFYLEKRSYQQISEITGYTIMQVKSNIQNGKRNIRIQMDRMPIDE